MATYQVPVWFTVEARDEEVAWMLVCEALAAADRHDTDLSGSMDGWVVESPEITKVESNLLEEFDDEVEVEPETDGDSLWESERW